jgi:hypothetical protein
MVAYVVNLKAAAAASNSPGQTQKSLTSNGKVLKPYVDGQTNLGSATLEGYVVMGETHSVEYPPGTQPGIRFMKVTTERWWCPQLGLPILTTVTSSKTGQVRTFYTNIVSSASVDPGLFSIPAGYQVVKPGASQVPTAN